MINIYRMRDTEKDLVIYVGQTTRPLADRLRENLQNFPQLNRETTIIELIEQCEADDVKEREGYWINHYHSINPDLLNAHLWGKKRGKREPKEISQSSHKGTFIGAYVSEEHQAKIKKVEEMFDKFYGSPGSNRTRALRYIINCFDPATLDDFPRVKSTGSKTN